MSFTPYTAPAPPTKPSHRKRNIIIITIIAALFVLVGVVGAVGGGHAKANIVATAPVTTDPTPDSDSVFVATMVAVDSNLTDDATPAQIAILGHAACMDLDQGQPFNEMLSGAENSTVIQTDSTLSSTEVAEIIGGAIVAFCPQYSADIPANS